MCVFIASLNLIPSFPHPHSFLHSIYDPLYQTSQVKMALESNIPLYVKLVDFLQV